jgi:hypothetical protein
MNHITTRRAAAIMSLALLATAAACGRKADDAAVAVDTAAMPPAMAAMRVAAVETGKAINADKSVVSSMSEFGVRDTVYAAVRTEGAGTGALAARWTFQDGQTVSESSQNIAPTGDAWHEFHIQKATAWPAGTYKVEITLDGVVAGSKDFTIR